MVSVCSLAATTCSKDAVDDMYQNLSLGAGNTDEPTSLGMMDVLIAGAGAFVAVQLLWSKKASSKDQHSKIPTNTPPPYSSLPPLNGNKDFQEVCSKDQEARTPSATPSRCSSLQPTPPMLPQDDNENLQELMCDVVQRGKPEQVKHILDQAYHRVVTHNPENTCTSSDATAHVLCAIKACASCKHYSECLAIYDHCSNRLGQGSASLWSNLLFCASRAEHQAHRCERFYANLCSLNSPRINDLVNVSVCFACTHNRDGLQAALADFVLRNGPLDCHSRNVVMGICAQKGAAELVEELALDQWSKIKDTCTYNTMMTCYVKANRQHECFRVFEEMQHAKVALDQFTVGILLDCCVQTHPIDIQHMMSLLDVFQAANVNMNHVHYTTLIKGLVQAGLVQNALQVLEQMRNQPSLTPDIITYSTVVKGLAELGDVDGALEWLEKLTQEGVMLDSTFFNTILLGCSKCSMPPARVEAILARFLSLGFKPEVGTLSVLVKAFVKSGSWSEALELIKDAKLQFDIQPDQNLYLQLAKAFSEAGQREWLLKACTLYFDDVKSRGVHVSGKVLRKMQWYCKKNKAENAYNRIVAMTT